MARTSRTVTEQEVLAYVKFCKDNNIVNYDGKDPETLANAELVLNYFLEVWKQDMNEVNFAQAFPQLKPHLKFYSSPQHAEYTHIANENIHAAQQLAAWLNTQGKPGQLANSGDDAYANLTLLLTELRNRRQDVSSTAIRDAENRIANRPGRQLHRVPQPRRTEPISPAAKADDGAPFLGGDMIKNLDGSYRNKTATEQRQDMEAAEKAKQTPAIRTEPKEAWEELCNQLKNYGTYHSQRAAMNETYDRGVANGKSFREIYAEMNQLRKQYEFSPAPLAPSIKARSIQ